MINLTYNSFPNDFTSTQNSRDILISFAVDSLIEVGNQIHGAENAFLSYDKETKRGALATS
jgi:hypothetical protein